MDFVHVLLDITRLTIGAGAFSARAAAQANPPARWDDNRPTATRPASTPLV
jgi:hypothetical protein